VAAVLRLLTGFHLLGRDHESAAVRLDVPATFKLIDPKLMRPHRLCPRLDYLFLRGGSVGKRDTAPDLNSIGFEVKQFACLEKCLDSGRGRILFDSDVVQPALLGDSGSRESRRPDSDNGDVVIGCAVFFLSGRLKALLIEVLDDMVNDGG